MPTCPACQHQNAADADICLNCAAVLVQSCPACGHTIPARHKFCGVCGERLPAGSSPAAGGADQPLLSLRAIMPPALAEKISAAAAEVFGERREVTVVFVDAANFSAPAGALDGEDAYVVIDEAMRVLVDVIYQYEGTVDKFTGDGLMALFGAPISHENDPERAVRAALEMQAALQPLRGRVKETHGFDFRVRVGIHTGLVVAGEVGTDLHMEYTVIGDTVNLASRLQAAAEPGAVWVSFATYQRSRPLFEFRALPPLILKGFPDPVQVFQPLDLLKRPGRVRGLPGLQVPMIGREKALAWMQNALAEVYRLRRSQIVLVTGEAGLGKSRLVAEFRQALTQPDASVFEGSCLAYARSRPMWVVTEVLRNILHLSEVDPPDVQLDAVQGYVDRMALHGDDTIPYLLHLLGLGHKDPLIGARLGLLDAPMLQRQTHAALRQVLLAEARFGPTVLIFEDLHWIDAASRDFVEHLIQTTADTPLMLVLVSRDAERATVLQPLIAAAEKFSERLVDIQLQPLSEAEGELLVDQLLRPTTPEAHALQKHIARRAEGIPFYIEEIVRVLIDRGALTGEDGAWEVSPQAHDLVHEVPGTLKGLILARFDRLPGSLRRTLQMASVVGRSFPVRLLQALDDADTPTTAAQLAQLESRKFLDAEPFGAEQGGVFHHALVQEAVYSTLLKRDRQKIHEKVAEAIQRTECWPVDEQVEILAYHYVESANPSKAVPYLIAAAENAARRNGNETAIQHYRQAITLMQQSPTGHRAELIRAQIGLGQALKFVGAFPEAGNVLREVVDGLRGAPESDGQRRSPVLLAESLRELAEVRHREGALEEAISHLEAALRELGPSGTLEQPRLWRSLMDRMAWVRFRQGRLDEAFALASSATVGLDPKHADDPITLASLYNTLGGVFWQQGNLSEAIPLVERSLNLYEGLGYSWGVAIAHNNLGILYFARGLWPRAAESFEQADRLRRENGYWPERAVNLKNLGELRLVMGDHEQARKDFETSLAISRRLGDDYGIITSEIGLSHLAVLQARFEEAAAHVDVARGLLDAAGEDQAVQVNLLQALLWAERGDLHMGLEAVQSGLEASREAGLPEEEADCLRTLGVLRGRMGEVAEAERYLHQSAALSVQRQDSYRQGRALYELGRLYERLSQAAGVAQTEWRAKALEALNRAARLFESLGAAHDLQLTGAALGHMQQAMRGGPDLALDQGGAPGTAASRLDFDLARTEWHTAAVVWLSLSPPPDANDEAVFETLSAVVPPLVTLARESQGEVLHRQDGLTVVFGAPVAHENDAERAVHTARRMLQHLTENAGQGDVPLTVRLAVSQGIVVAGHIRHQAKVEFVVTGEPVQMAQFVAESAAPGKVWVTEAVRTATERIFLYEIPSSRSGAHLSHLSVSELVGLVDRPGPARGLPRRQTRLIGRETALQAMIDLSQNLTRGTGGLIWIEGEAGIGKSRLMREFAAQMESRAMVWAGQCSPQRSAQALSLFSHLLAQGLGLPTTDEADPIHARINQVVQLWPAEARAGRPFVEMLSGVNPTGLEGERLASLEPDQLRQQTFVMLRSMLKSLATEQPVVLLLDDLHWADTMSTELMLFLANMVASVPILFVCALRWEENEKPDERLVRMQRLHPAQTLRLFLNRLSLADSEALLSEVLSEAEPPTGLRTLVLQRSEGNPYYIEEIARMLIEQGYLRYSGGQWEVDESLNVRDLPVPTSLGGLIRSRVDALLPELKQLLQCAAVLGSPFEANLLATIAEMPDVRLALLRLEARGMLARTAEPEQWQFSHALVEVAVYHTLLKVRRQALHLKVALALQARWAGSEQAHAEVLAFHFTQADEGARALGYLVLAGERAAARYANEEALVYFQQAARLLSTERDVVDTLRWRVAVGLGDVHRFVGEFAESTAALEAGLPLLHSDAIASDRRAGLVRRLGETAQKRGELDKACGHFITARAILGEPGDRYAQAEAGRILGSLAWTQFLQGQLDQAKESCEASLTYAQSAGNLNVLATAERVLGGIHYRRGEREAALQHTTRAMALSEQMGYTWGVAAAQSNLGILAVSAGDWRQAQRFFTQSLELRQQLGDVEGVAIVHNNLASLARDQGNLEVAEYHFRKSLAVARPLNMAYHTVTSTLGLAQVLLLKGDSQRAQESVAVSLAEAATIGAQDVLAETYRVRAEILLAQSAPEEAMEAVRQSIGLAAEIGNRSLEAAAWRVASEIELRAGDVEAAAEAIGRARQALGLATDELEAGRVAAQAGRVSLRRGETAQAARDLQMAKELFARLGATLDLAHVEHHAGV